MGSSLARCLSRGNFQHWHAHGYGQRRLRMQYGTSQKPATLLHQRRFRSGNGGRSNAKSCGLQVSYILLLFGPLNVLVEQHGPCVTA